MGLSALARQKFNAYQQGVANYYGGAVGGEFTATPAIEQTLIDKAVEHGGWFMPYMMMMMVQQLVGEKVLMKLTGLSATRTDTTNTDRVARSLLGDMENRQYTLKKTDNDFKIKYSDLDTWSQFRDFNARYQAMLRTAIIDSIVMVGWHGVSAAATTNPATYTLGQDVNIGWLQRIRAFNSGSQWNKGKSLACTFTDTGDVVTSAGHGLVNGQVVQFSTINTTTGISINTNYYVVNAATDTFKVSDTLGGAAKALTTDGTGVILAPITIGTGKDYSNLDVLISDAKNMIKPWLRNGLVAYVSDNLIAKEEGKYYQQTTERAAEKLLIAQNGGVILQTFGGLRCVVPPFFPDDTILISPVGGLHYYMQTGSVRRTLRDWPEGDCIKDMNSVNDGYVVYNEEACYLIENIDTLD